MRLFLLPLVVLLSGCTGMLLGGGNGGTAPAEGERTAAAVAADGDTTAAVRGRLAADPMLGQYRLGIETREGRVTLQGTVDTYSARSRAGMLAREVDGVVSVNNRIRVTAGN
jgi:hyperosmotically inducible periplasmic protein